MFKGIKRSASVQAHSPCKLSLLRRESFKMMTENYPEFIARIEGKISQYDYRRIANVPLDFNKEIFPNEIKDLKNPGPEHEERGDEHPGTSLNASLGPFASTEGHFVKKSKKELTEFPYIMDYADIIPVLEKGRLAEQGSHDELIRLNNIYYYLYNLKSKVLESKQSKNIQNNNQIKDDSVQCSRLFRA